MAGSSQPLASARYSWMAWVIPSESPSPKTLSLSWSPAGKHPPPAPQAISFQIICLCICTINQIHLDVAKPTCLTEFGADLRNLVSMLPQLAIHLQKYNNEVVIETLN